MRSYQSILILKPDLDETQVDQALEKISEFLKESGGSCLKIEKWGKKRLAYRVKKTGLGTTSIFTILVIIRVFPAWKRNINYLRR